MKYWIYPFMFLASLAVVPAAAYAQGTQAPEYTFERYVGALVKSTYVDPENQVRQSEVKKEKKYEPMNPVTLLRW